jgi:hypothetical protein
MASSRHVAARFLIGALTACTSVEGNAKNYFAWRYSCPDDRVTFTERPDLRRHDAPPAPTHATPPPEVAADPQRLAMFRETERKENEVRAATAEDTRYIIEVSGCGVTELSVCQIACGHFRRCCLPFTR